MKSQRYMAKLIAIAGMPGSGKSTYIEKIKGTVRGLVNHDYHGDAFKQCSDFMYARAYPALVHQLKKGNDCIIADIMYCDQQRRQEVEQAIAWAVPGTLIEWQCFTNEPDKCRRNVEARNRPQKMRELELISELTRNYVIPAGAKTLPVYAG